MVISFFYCSMFDVQRESGSQPNDHLFFVFNVWCSVCRVVTEEKLDVQCFDAESVSCIVAFFRNLSYINMCIFLHNVYIFSQSPVFSY